MPPAGPFKLVTVNSAPERAKRIVGIMIEKLKDKYTIVHAGNAESPEAARAVLEEIKPDIVFTASMWTPEQSSKVMEEAREVNPKVKTLAIPQGLQAAKGPDGVVEYVTERIPSVLAE